MNILLSIIIPYHNTKKELDELLNVLITQKTQNVEIIIIDDGSEIPYKTQYDVKLIRLNECSGGASKPRNIGLDNAKGKYIVFCDSDDLVSDDYIRQIIEKIQEEDFDYCYFSWKNKNITVMIYDEPPAWNCCVWNCIYKKDLIGDKRFNLKFKMAEDAEFNNKVRKGKKAIIPKILYYYNNTRENSLTKQGKLYNNKYIKSEV